MKRITLILTLVAIFVVGTISTTVAQAKEKKTIEQSALKNATGKKVIDITSPKVQNVEGKPAAEDKSRGDVYGSDYCDVIIDNWTGYSIDIYVDGSFRGTIAPFDKNVTWAVKGTTSLYGEASGTTYYWGPRNVDCGYEYTWKLKY